MEALIKRALEAGFTNAVPLHVSTLALRTEVRDMCAANRCRLYGKSWMCPPACGSLEELTARMSGYTTGLIVQTTAKMEDDFDYEVMRSAGDSQKRKFLLFARALRAEYPELFALTSGGCDLCEACGYPDTPCRHPGEAMPSMEAFGLVVSDVCAANGIPYYYGPQTITYTGCYLVT